MNERIKEIAEENGLIHDWMPAGEQREILQRYKMFAELIVQECAEIFEGVCVYTDQQRPERIDTIIKEHFGVE